MKEFYKMVNLLYLTAEDYHDDKNSYDNGHDNEEDL